MSAFPPPPLSTPLAEEKKVRAGGGAGGPPEWGVEKFFKAIGVVPAAPGRGLTRLAGKPGVGVVVRFFSSVVLGIVLLLLLGTYIGVGSGLPSLRAKLEMTDLQFFDAWPMRVLLGLLAVNLTVVTLRRIPLTLFKLGVWMVHIGILTLIGGSVWYFSQKQEGSVRIFLHHTVDSYFDATERALYAFRVDDQGGADLSKSTMTPLPTLPIFYEHLASNGKALGMELPEETLGALSPGLKDARLTITGYYPAAEMINAWTVDPAAVADGNGDSPNPALRVSMALEGISTGQWLVGKRPAERVLDAPGAPFGIEYLYHPTPETVQDVETAFTGPQGIVVRVPKLGVTRSYTVEAGDVVAVEGTPYTLTVQGQMAMPMVSKGYEGSMSNSLRVTVNRKDAAVPGGVFTFDRMALSRYPERSPDFVMKPDGTQKRVQDRVDNDIQIDFQDASRDQFWIVEPLDRPMVLVHRKAGGAVETSGIEVGKPAQVNVSTVAMTLTVVERAARVVATPVPRVIPVEARERSVTAMDAMQNSVIEVKFAQGEAKRTVYVPFSQFAQIGDPPGGKQPAVIEVPGVGRVGLMLATTRRALPSTVELSDFAAVKYPGAESSYENYISTLLVKDNATGAERTMVAQLNDPATDHGLYYFQAAWDGDDHAPVERRFSVIGVGNRPGIDVMVLGAVLIIAGIGYAFYVKPILLNVKKRQLAAWAGKTT